MHPDVLEFVFFCIEETAAELHLSGDVVYDMLARRSDILQHYLIPCYQVLHTQGRDYLVEDILTVMREKGVLPA